MALLAIGAVLLATGDLSGVDLLLVFTLDSVVSSRADSHPPGLVLLEPITQGLELLDTVGEVGDGVPLGMCPAVKLDTVLQLDVPYIVSPAHLGCLIARYVH